MTIHVEFLGLPMVSDVVGKKKLEMELSGLTVRDTIDELARRYGKKVREALFNADGHFDPMIQIVLNGIAFIPPDKHDTPLKDGDSLSFMLLAAGG